MLKYGSKKFIDEADLRAQVEKSSVGQLNGRENYSPNIAGVIHYNNRRTVLANVKNPAKAKKSTLVNAYVKYIMASATEYKVPETFEELAAAVIRETMAYEGCYSGKAEWLESVGLEAPPAPLQLEMRITGLKDVSTSGEMKKFLENILPEGVTVDIDSCEEYDDY